MENELEGTEERAAPPLFITVTLASSTVPAHAECLQLGKCLWKECGKRKKKKKKKKKAVAVTKAWS